MTKRSTPDTPTHEHYSSGEEQRDISMLQSADLPQPDENDIVAEPKKCKLDFCRDFALKFSKEPLLQVLEDDHADNKMRLIDIEVPVS